MSERTQDQVCADVMAALDRNSYLDQQHVWRAVELSVAQSLIAAALDAARVEGREQAAQAIEVEADRPPLTVREHMARHSFNDSRRWLKYAARLARQR